MIPEDAQYFDRWREDNRSAGFHFGLVSSQKDLAVIGREAGLIGQQLATTSVQQESNIALSPCCDPGFCGDHKRLNVDGGAVRIGTQIGPDQCLDGGCLVYEHHIPQVALLLLGAKNRRVEAPAKEFQVRLARLTVVNATLMLDVFANAGASNFSEPADEIAAPFKQKTAHKARLCFGASG
ncbi:hypothetical protein ACFDR6_30515 [Bradyrhizobium sp. 1AS20L]